MQLEALAVLAADHASYWFAGILTVLASVIVIVVMLVTSRSENGNSN